MTDYVARDRRRREAEAAFEKEKQREQDEMENYLLAHAYVVEQLRAAGIDIESLIEFIKGIKR